jgi:hypothetical protein
MDLIQSITYGASQSYMCPFDMPYNISLSYLRIPVAMVTSATGSSSVVSGTTGAQWTCGISSNWNAMIYSRNVGASSMSLASYASGEADFSTKLSYSNNSAGSRWSVSETIWYPVGSLGNTSLVSNWASSSKTLTFGTTELANFTGTRWVDFPMATSLSAGRYWLCIGSASSSETSVSQLAFATSPHVKVTSAYGVTQINSNFGEMNAATTATQQLQHGIGSFSTNATATTASMGLSNISSSASHPLLYFQMIRVT